MKILFIFYLVYLECTVSYISGPIQRNVMLFTTPSWENVMIYIILVSGHSGRLLPFEVCPTHRCREKSKFPQEIPKLSPRNPKSCTEKSNKFAPRNPTNFTEKSKNSQRNHSCISALLNVYIYTSISASLGQTVILLAAIEKQKQPAHKHLSNSI